jgi:hypothetical protein
VLKANELRLGNILRLKNQEGYLTVSMIEQSGSLYFDESPELHYDLEDDEILPVELTEQWLAQLGFNKRTIQIDEHGLLRIVDRGIYEIVEFTDAETYRSYDNRILYVHQLQNLFFALSDGIELKVKGKLE